MTEAISRTTSKGIHVVAMVSNGETWVFMFDDAHRSECLHTLGRYASDYNMSFSWYDAARIAQRIRECAR